MQKDLGFIIGGGARKSIALNDLDRFFPTLLPGTKRRTVLALYRLVAWTYRCVQLRANGTMSVPWKLSRRGNEDSEVELQNTPYADVDWEWLWWRTEAARLIWGAAYWLKRADGELQWLNPGTMTPVKNTVTGELIGFRQIVGANRRTYPVDQIVYLPTWNPDDDVLPGVADAGVAQPPGALVANANEWTSMFFANGALPLTILSSDRVVPPQEITRLETTWERFKSGIKNAFKTVVLGWGLKPTVIGFPLDKLALPELMQEEKEQISGSFGIPITMLDASAANFATAKQDDVHFYTKTIFPQLRLVRGAVNRQLWWPLNYEMHWQFNEVEAIQQDEAEKAEGIALLMEEMDRQSAAKVLTRPRSVWLAEELWGALGYDFPPDKPDEEPEEPGPAEQMPPNMLERQRRVREITQGVTAAQNKSVDNTAMLASLRRWRRKVKNRKGVADFESENVPEWVSKAVKKRLATQLDTAFDPFLKAIPDIQGGLEATLQRRISAIYTDWLDRITNAALTGMPTDLAPMYTEIQAATEIMYTDAISSGALAQAADLGWGVDYDDLLTEGLEWAGQEGRTLVGRISGTDRKYVDKIRGQLQAGEITEDAAREMIAKAFGKVRASAIAATETTRALAESSFALQADLAAQGVTTVQRWLTAEDERVCFPAGTPVLTKRGYRSIETIKAGELVLTRDGYKRVTAMSARNYSGMMIQVWHESGSFTCTIDHPVWVVEKGWLEAGEIQVGDSLQAFMNQVSRVIRVLQFSIGDTDNLPTPALQEMSLGQVSLGVSVPVGSVNLQGDPMSGQQKVNAVSPHSSFLDILKIKVVKNKADLLLQQGLALKGAITRKAAELAIGIFGLIAKLFAAVATLFVMWRPATLFATVAPNATLFAGEDLPAPLTCNVFGFGKSTSATTDGIAVSDTFGHRKALATLWANFRDRLLFARRFVASPRTELLAALDSTWDKVKLLAALLANAVFARALAFCWLKLHSCRITWHSSPLMMCLSQLYHRLCVKSIPVYNLQVEDVPEYFAGTGRAVLVHNCPICGPLDHTTEDSWLAEFPTGPPAHVNCRCILSVEHTPGAIGA